ncbi:SusC/RagA family TonB-linked outer membrane protein [Mucilaginibacter sp. UR6-11]|uniref:SusC/RagA family TonB-linked outer membrane protein n=1 Tax=Mucilaginibacter sp. UR6-11 TaxID=1435644 RepID=UPI001E296C49|nr:SusC/RagA family TonB-linked outer membrane protein [Mucilaginibacter sp. UR6-11]MCC8426388.1 SusC/RagA family TonB-linked outer membrane protein [Mucilaginibacter sp. UR6-11]
MSKILLTMKLTTLILLIAILQVSATSFAQKITLSEKNAPLVDVFNHIRLQTGYDFLVTTTMLSNIKPVTIRVKNAELADVLKQLFKDQQYDYKIDNRSVIISPKQPSLLEKLIAAIKAINVMGKVVDEKGSPIVGATVRIKDDGKVTTTDVNGNFYLQNVGVQSVVVISSIGYLTKELNVKPDMGIITLEASISKLDQVMVIAYGTTTQRLSTGAISHVKGEELDQQPISNPILGLEGRVPGAFITQTAGYAGAQFNILVRGQNSFAGSTNNFAAPLYIVDGVPFGGGPVEQSVGGFGVLVALSPLNTIDPTQIESIDVLKDADATAIYGSRGANGVVLITTKKGKPGNTKVSVDVSSGYGEVTNLVKLLNTDQYLAVRRQAFANDNVTPTTVNAPELTLWDQHAYTNFPKLLLGNKQHQSKATFSLSGGDLFTQFILGGNYRHESSVLPTNTADDAVQFHLSAQHRSHDNKFGVTTSVSYNIDNNSLPSYSLNVGNYNLPPNYPLYNKDGSLYFGTSFSSPLAGLNTIYNLKSNNLISNISLHYMVIPGLDLKVNAGYNYDNVYSSTIQPASANNPLNNFSPTSTLGNNYIKTYIVEPQINYTHTWGKGKLTALVGGTWQETQYVQPYYLLGSFTNIQLANSLAALTLLIKTSGYTDYKYDSGFGRLEYEWDGKYLFSGNIRRDGSSRFGSEHPFGTFGSAAAAWIFSREDLVKNKTPWLSFGKLKASYGSVGNDKTLQDYAYLSTYQASTAYGPISSLSPAGILNPYLQWEQTTKLDVAVDLGFINNRIFLSAAYYRNRTSHLLANTAIPLQTGFGSYSSNLPDGAVVQNTGLELELSTVNIKSKGFTWNTSFNFTLPENKLLSFPGILTSTYANTYVVGQSLNLVTGYHSTGVVNGIATAQDVNGDGVLTSGYSATGKSDYIILGNADPKFYGGLDNTFSYKGLQLDFLFQFVKRKATRGDLNFSSYPGLNYNLPESRLDVPLKYSSAFGTPATNAYGYYVGSDAVFEDASFIRLKNVSLAYNFPAVWAKNLKMASFQVYVHAQNLLTITKYKGIDPETLAGTIPTLRMMVAGIKTTF